MDCPQADVTRVGGVTEFLRVAALARAHQRDLSAHCAPHLHAAVMCAVPNARHIEWFHDHVPIETMLFDGCLDPPAAPSAPARNRATASSSAARRVIDPRGRTPPITPGPPSGRRRARAPSAGRRARRRAGRPG
ncbi:enolase C-terminal domain-like protein [Actinomadura roseirufa]|uniref:enolase C-terminal domain-like protein n=1 Tax=Actinomadura roseirufa TaxID=2094049 RepID=UPI001F5E3CCE|nr:enolase C-terminal domain-like protein [Actinomadura roseirufa]